MKPSKRLERIPPYAFAQLERKIAEKRAAGVDVISLGIGDPDRPTPALIVEAMQEAVTEPATHQYPSNRGRADFRGAVRDFYERRFDVKLDPEREIIPAIGAKEAIFNLNLAFLDPGDYALAADPGYPVYTGGPWLAGAEPVLMALEPEPRLRARPRGDRRGRRSQEQADVPQLPQQPHRRGRARRVLRAGRRVRPRARHPRRPRQRLLGDPLRRLQGPLVPRDAGRQGGRHRGLLALQGLQHDRLALRRPGRQRRGPRDLLASEDEHRLGAVRGRPARRHRRALAGRRRRGRLDERALQAPPRPRLRRAAQDRHPRDARRTGRSTCGRPCRRASRARPPTASTCSRRPPWSSRRAPSTARPARAGSGSR